MNKCRYEIIRNDFPSSTFKLEIHFTSLSCIPFYYILPNFAAEMVAFVSYFTVSFAVLTVVFRSILEQVQTAILPQIRPGLLSSASFLIIPLHVISP